MAWTKIQKAGIGAAAILVAAGIATIVVVVLDGSLAKGRLRLPVGKGVPSVSVGERHGLVLASDGSLSSQLFFTQLSKDIFVTNDEELVLRQYVLQEISAEF